MVALRKQVLTAGRFGSRFCQRLLVRRPTHSSMLTNICRGISASNSVPGTAIMFRGRWPVTTSTRSLRRSGLLGKGLRLSGGMAEQW